MTNLYFGKFEEVADQISDSSVDLVLTDPPYNISKELHCLDWEGNTIHSMQFDEKSKNKWDSKSDSEFIASLDTWAKLISAKLRKNGHFVIFMSDRYLSHLWFALEANGLEPKRTITIRKPSAVPFNRKSRIISGCEYAIYGIKTSGKGKKKLTFNANTTDKSLVAWNVADKISSIVYKHVREAMLESGPFVGPRSIAVLAAQAAITEYMKNPIKEKNGKYELVIPNELVLSFNTKGKIHPNEKPIKLLEYFISLLSNPGDVVLDPFAGSGSTGAAAIKLKRDYMLVEAEEKYFKLIEKRLEKSDR